MDRDGVVIDSPEEEEKEEESKPSPAKRARFNRSISGTLHIFCRIIFGDKFNLRMRYLTSETVHFCNGYQVEFRQKHNVTQKLGLDLFSAFDVAFLKMQRLSVNTVICFQGTCSLRHTHTQTLRVNTPSNIIQIKIRWVVT